ncbi:unnamed protein product [Brugia pahangi]|uniref:BRCT domain-containing protein n=1 Tax=Brugia pahangi TaxID=6280 RepID=A0A0N4TN75_BRUPA|nr:unnamed protein product [Brugia pahangi]
MANTPSVSIKLYARDFIYVAGDFKSVVIKEIEGERKAVQGLPNVVDGVYLSLDHRFFSRKRQLEGVSGIGNKKLVFMKYGHAFSLRSGASKVRGAYRLLQIISELAANEAIIVFNDNVERALRSHGIVYNTDP